MSSSSDRPIPFKVIWSGTAIRQVGKLAGITKAEGRHQSLRFAHVLRSIERALTWIPLEYGEPVKELTSVNLQTCVCFAEEVVVNYGVNHSRKIVFVRDFRKMTRNRLK